MLRLSGAGASHIGLVRHNNEDAAFVAERFVAALAALAGVRVAIHQPQYWPWPPYLHKVLAAV